ncbi:MAG TPA: 2-phospho-L-lactate guanylyltransferase [Solirubrobacteraceae bacterium]|jgi:2-phospho-L-lactate guanylyltransferase|nr:2-phospho-L-lactate guanylyltransferase [Solirubrobacteraceae bacterium]
MRTAAILPVKRFARAKQRLGASVADPLRVELAEAMVADVLLALAHTHSIEQTILVTGERSVAVAAREHGAIVIEDERERGQPQAAELGVRRALAGGFERVLCVPGDCPTLDPTELNALLENDPGGPRQDEVVVVPDRHGTGTNGLLLAPPQAISPSFGPGSCERHRALAHAAGVACRVERVPSLLLDIDTGADLDVLRARLAAHPARAARTRAVLGQPERTNIISIPTPV